MQEFLKEQREYNVDHKILPSENRVIDRLLVRNIEMNCVYEELSQKLSAKGREEVLRIVLSAAAFWSPEQSRYLRNARRNLGELNVSGHSRMLLPLSV